MGCLDMQGVTGVRVHSKLAVGHSSGKEGKEGSKMRKKNEEADEAEI